MVPLHHIFVAASISYRCVYLCVHLYISLCFYLSTHYWRVQDFFHDSAFFSKVHKFTCSVLCYFQRWLLVFTLPQHAARKSGPEEKHAEAFSPMGTEEVWAVSRHIITLSCNSAPLPGPENALRQSPRSVLWNRKQPRSPAGRIPLRSIHCRDRQ